MKTTNPWKRGDLVRIIEDPMSFTVGDDVIGLPGLIFEINEEKEIFSVMLLGGTKVIKVLSFMMEKINDS